MVPENEPAVLLSPPRRHRAGLRMIAGAIGAFVATLLLVPACLITATPQFVEPQPGTPVLTPDSPDPHSIIQIDLRHAFSPVFRATLESEDGTGSSAKDVQIFLYVDYGTQNGSHPFFFANSFSFGKSHANDLRHVAITWDPELQLQVGCHTVTLVASHGFDERDCPTDPPSAYLTWFVSICDSMNPDVDCNRIAFDTETSGLLDAGGETITTCPTQLVTCDSYFPDAGDAGDGDAP